MYFDPTVGRRVPFPTLEEREAAFQVRRKEYEAYVSGLKHKGLHGLSGEIDRCLKKVSEGVETFEDIWQKVHNATNTNQKEKYETDLKKEIKKLQRLRDQIKSWIASGEIKDKSTLVDTRKLIETQMERFKVVERETKTKAYSKEGLGAAQKLDPMTRERDELTNWLAASIDSVQVQMDQFESEIELIMAAKKKRLDKEKQDRLDELKVYLEKHKFHMSKLETLMRMLDNLAADPNAVSSTTLRNFLNQVRKIKDDMEYYLESSQEPEFEENEFMYDDIDGLEEQQALGNSIGAGGDAEFTGTPTSTASGNTSPVSPIHSSDSSSDPEKLRKSSDDSSKVVRPVAMKPNHTSTPPPSGTNKTVSTPPIHAGTPNNSSPSSGLMSNHVSSFSSLSSSPTQTHNYHNALNNVKSLPQVDGSEQNDTDSNATISESATTILLSSGSANGGLSHSLLSNSSEPFEFQSTQGAAGSTLTSSSTPPTIPPTSTTTVTSNGLRNSFGDGEDYDSLPSSPTHHDPKSHHHLYHPVGLHSSKEEQESLENGTAENHVTGTHSAPPPLSLAAMSMTALANLGTGSNGGGNHLNLLGSGSNDSGSTNGALSLSVTNTLQPSISALNISSNSTSSLSSQQQLQQASATTPAQTQGSKGQPGSSREVTSPTTAMDFMRIAPEQMLLDRYLNTSDSDRIEAMASLKTMAQEAMDRAGIHDPSSLQRTTTEAHIPPLLGVAPLGPVPLGRDHQTQFQMLESGHYHMPVPADSERMRQFLPRNPIPTPGYYPQAPLLNSDSLDFFGRLSIETLFFIFYYLEGTKAQYLAAKVLKKQSWRFHTKYMMWFQRHEEPKVINEEYEQGTYIYFDIEKWGQRKKDGFVFEYRYLEDRDLS